MMEKSTLVCRGPRRTFRPTLPKQHNNYAKDGRQDSTETVDLLTKRCSLLWPQRIR